MDRREAKKWFAQMRPRFKDDTEIAEALDLAIEALEGDLHCPKCGTIVRDGRQYHDLVYRGEVLVNRGDAESATTTDYISRSDIEYHTQLEANGNGQYEEMEVAYKSDIDNLPPVTPTERTGEWIPVSEGLPKEKQEVYVTVYFTEGDTGRAYGHIDGFGTWHLYSTVEGTLNGGYKVTAWMPLPEPYKGGDTE